MLVTRCEYVHDKYQIACGYETRDEDEDAYPSTSFPGRPSQEPVEEEVKGVVEPTAPEEEQVKGVVEPTEIEEAALTEEEAAKRRWLDRL